MELKTKLTIPKHKIYGERLGQLIYNAIRKHWLGKSGVILPDQIADYLFECGNDELQKIIDDYLKSANK